MNKTAILRQTLVDQDLDRIDTELDALSYGFVRGGKQPSIQLLRQIDVAVLREVMQFAMLQSPNYSVATANANQQHDRKIISIANSILGAIYLSRNKGDKLRQLIDPEQIAMLCQHLATGEVDDFTGSFHTIYAMIDEEDPRYNILRSMAIAIRAVPSLLDQTDPEIYANIFDIEKIQALHDYIPITLVGGQPAPDEIRIAIASSQKARLTAFGLIAALWYGDQTFDSRFADAFSDQHIGVVRERLESGHRIIRNSRVIERLRQYVYQR